MGKNLEGKETYQDPAVRPNAWTNGNSQVKNENTYLYVSKIDTQNKNTKLKPEQNKTHETTQCTLSLPHHSKELGAGRCHANLETTR